jgi:hypothetical protein
VQKLFPGDTSPGTPEERTRHPLAPRQVNVVAQEGERGQHAVRTAAGSSQTTTPLAMSRPASSGTTAPHAEERAGGERRTGPTAKGAQPQRPDARHSDGHGKDRHAEKHAQYLSRLHSLVPALRQSAAPASASAAPEHPPPQQPHAPAQRIGRDWKLFPIVEKAGSSPESSSVLSVSPADSALTADSSRQHDAARCSALYCSGQSFAGTGARGGADGGAECMAWQHIMPQHLSTPRLAADGCVTAGAGRCGPTRTEGEAEKDDGVQSSTEPMDLSADDHVEEEAWVRRESRQGGKMEEGGSGSHAAGRSPPVPSSPTPSFPSPVSSPPSSSINDWLGGNRLWTAPALAHAETRPPPPPPPLEHPAVVVLATNATVQHRSAAGNSSGGDHTENILHSGECDTADALLALEAVHLSENVRSGCKSSRRGAQSGCKSSVGVLSREDSALGLQLALDVGQKEALLHQEPYVPAAVCCRACRVVLCTHVTCIHVNCWKLAHAHTSGQSNTHVHTQRQTGELLDACRFLPTPDVCIHIV